MVGKSLQLKIIEINRNRNRLILSERLAVQEWRARRREELLNELEVGEIRQGTVSNLANFGAFVDLGGADGLVHISQLAWSRVNHPSEVLKVGQKVEVQVLSVAAGCPKIALSIKRAEVDPWTTVEQRYEVGQTVQGTITKIAPFGAFARIEDGVEGLIHLSEMPAGTQDPKTALQEGQEVTVRIVRIEPDRRRLGLSIRQLGDEAITQAEGETSPPEPQDVAESGAAAPAPRAETSPAEPAARQRPAQPEAPTTAMAEAFRAFQQQQATRDRDEVGEVGEATDAENADASATIAQAPTEASDTAAAESATDVEPAVVEQAVEAPDVDVTIAPEASPSGEAEAEAVAPETETAEETPEETPEHNASETPASENTEDTGE
jgi:small subunit ribosomal protein S1